MSRKYRTHKRRRSQAVTSLELSAEYGDANGDQDAELDDAMDVDDPKSSRLTAGENVEGEQLDEPPQEPDEDFKRKQEIWDTFQEEHHEGVLSLC